jgi:hypothetical protein
MPGYPIVEAEGTISFLPATMSTAGTWICCQAKTGKANNNNRREVKSPALIYDGVYHKNEGKDQQDKSEGD